MNWRQAARGQVRRGRITRFSEASRRRLAFTARNVPPGSLRVLLTLTYPAEFPTSGRVVKQHWRAMREWLERRGIAGLWFFEWQQRGAPHLHVFLTGPVTYQAVAEEWYQVVGSGDPRHLQAGTRIEWLRSPDAAGRYATKYALKCRQKEPPPGFEEVGRFWGVFGKLNGQRFGVQLVNVVTGWLGEVAPLIRLIRRAEAARRREGGLRRRRDSGRTGWTAYGLGPIAAGGLAACVG